MPASKGSVSHAARVNVPLVTTPCHAPHAIEYSALAKNSTINVARKFFAGSATANNMTEATIPPSEVAPAKKPANMPVPKRSGKPSGNLGRALSSKHTLAMNKITQPPTRNTCSGR